MLHDSSRAEALESRLPPARDAASRYEGYLSSTQSGSSTSPVLDLYRGARREIPVGYAGQGGAGDSVEPASASGSAPLTALPMIPPSELASIALSAYKQLAQGEKSWKAAQRGKGDVGISMEQALFSEPLTLHPYHPGHKDREKYLK
mmetsp:Transcript_23678/g.54687  ORF Transcript_23678/g.54687 Transcript_23678/m.54687 type:complete len:147 (+) Transcript_23678:48-488(+)